MARERNLKREYEQRKLQKQNTISIAANIPKTLNEDFTAKVELVGSTKSATIKELISDYTYGDNSKKSGT